MVLVIDNYDSFTFNLVQYLGELGANPLVKRNDEIDVDQILALQPSGIVLSPGPCTPNESGVCLNILRASFGMASPISRIPILGVCLGHQAIGLVAGGVVAGSKSLMHGKTSLIEHDGKGVFAGLASPLRVTRYHSLAVREESIPKTLEITSRALDDGEVMGLRHTSLPVEGVQFHPESVLSDSGMEMIRNFLKSCRQPAAS